MAGNGIENEGNSGFVPEIRNLDTGSLNYLWGLSLIHAYASSGVQHAVLSPGSRSTPLTLACERHSEITTWVQVDERSAAFFALGLAINSGQPVILVCTSGSAVANWLPAVVEANYSQVPLILLSADRPEELQNCGANQTIDQQHLFGSHVRAFHAVPEPAETLLNSYYLQKLVAKSLVQLQQPLRGPVHLNIPLREPLLPADGYLNERIDELTNVLTRQAADYTCPDIVDDSQPELDAIVNIIQQSDGIIVVGRKQYSSTFAETLNQLAEQFSIPVLVDPLSNLRFGKHGKSNYIVNYDLFLSQIQQAGLPDIKPGWVIRFGQFPVSKSLLDFLSDCADAVNVVIGENKRWQDPLRSANFLIKNSDESFCQQLLKRTYSSDASRELIHAYKKLDDIAAETIDSILRLQQHLIEGHLISKLVEKLPENSFLFSSNSTAVRQLDMFTVMNQYSSKSISLYCNRGASGIDGNLSTYLGILADNKAATGIALLGDLAFFHDINGLALCADLNARGRKGTIIIINNGGGHIFNYLPQKNLNEFEKYWLTPVKMDLLHAAALFGLNYQKAGTIASLEQVLDRSLSCPGIDIVEVVIDQQSSLRSSAEIRGRT